jgi:hypothetical protein
VSAVTPSPAPHGAPVPILPPAAVLGALPDAALLIGVDGALLARNAAAADVFGPVDDGRKTWPRRASTGTW